MSLSSGKRSSDSPGFVLKPMTPSDLSKLANRVLSNDCKENKVSNGQDTRVDSEVGSKRKSVGLQSSSLKQAQEDEDLRVGVETVVVSSRKNTPVKLTGTSWSSRHAQIQAQYGLRVVQAKEAAKSKQKLTPPADKHVQEDSCAWWTRCVKDSDTEESPSTVYPHNAAKDISSQSAYNTMLYAERDANAITAKEAALAKITYGRMGNVDAASGRDSVDNHDVAEAPAADHTRIKVYKYGREVPAASLYSGWVRRVNQSDLYGSEGKVYYRSPLESSDVAHDYFQDAERQALEARKREERESRRNIDHAAALSDLMNNSNDYVSEEEQRQIDRLMTAHTIGSSAEHASSTALSDVDASTNNDQELVDAEFLLDQAERKAAFAEYQRIQREQREQDAQFELDLASALALSKYECAMQLSVEQSAEVCKMEHTMASTLR